MSTVVERTELLIKSGLEEEFAAAMNGRGKALLAGVPGVKGVTFGRGVENPDKFILLVEWDSMDAHSAYRTTPTAAAVRELIGPFSRGASMEHFALG
jgi:heme-degrading monooxygenase HmoA